MKPHSPRYAVRRPFPRHRARPPDTDFRAAVTAPPTTRLHRIALVRMSSHQPTKDYVATSTAQRSHSKMEILRKLKRAIAREVFKLLTRQIAVPEYVDLRPARQAKNITVTAAANHFGVWPTVISRIERGLQRDDTLRRYLQKLA